MYAILQLSLLCSEFLCHSTIASVLGSSLDKGPDPTARSCPAHCKSIHFNPRTHHPLWSQMSPCAPTSSSPWLCLTCLLGICYPQAGQWCGRDTLPKTRFWRLDLKLWVPGPAGHSLQASFNVIFTETRTDFGFCLFVVLWLFGFAVVFPRGAGALERISHHA